jgi:hypothetical protein
LASGKFRIEFGRFPSVKNTGCPEVLPRPSKVVASEYRIMDSRFWSKGTDFFAVSHQSHSYCSPKILIFSFLFLFFKTK